jgi:hypothetical protein
MSRLWLSVLMVIALGFGGVANAMVRADCPMLAAAEDGAFNHDCCPDNAPAAPGDQPSKQMSDCAMAMACRAGPAVAPVEARASAPATPSALRVAPVLEQRFPSTAPDDFWRPPRTT